MIGASILRDRQWILLSAFAAVLAVLIVFAEMVPRARAVAASALDLTRGHDSAVDAGRIAAELERLQGQREALEAALSDLAEDRGCGSCTAEVFGGIRKLIDESGVTLIEFRPAPTTTSETTWVTPVEITAIGRYHDLGRCVDAIERMREVVAVRRLDAKASDTSGSLDIRLALEIVSIREIR